MCHSVSARVRGFKQEECPDVEIFNVPQLIHVAHVAQVGR